MPCPHNEISIVQRSQQQSAIAAVSIFAYFHSIHDLHQLKKALPFLREGMTSYRYYRSA